MRILALFATVLLSSSALCQVGPRVEATDVIGRNERGAVKAMITIFGAEATYFATTGNGNYGTLLDLHQAELIDADLAKGEKHGYVFNVFFKSGTLREPAEIVVVAIPREYNKSGRISFYVSALGDVHAADRKGRPANSEDPIIDVCSSGTIDENERCIFRSLITLPGAQETFRYTTDGYSYGSLGQLFSARLISKGYSRGPMHGYSIKVVTVPKNGDRPPEFKIYATPEKYGVTGERSFFVGMDGVIRGAYKHGKPADENDLPARQCTRCSIAENEAAAIGAMSTFNGAQATFFAVKGEKYYATVQMLREENLIDRTLSSGYAYGYRFIFTLTNRSSRQPASYEICALPAEYPDTGARSFFVDVSGVIRGADKKGKCADQNDPKVDY